MKPVFVSTKEDLKNALNNKNEEILITNEKLAGNVKTISYASKAAITAALAGVGITATNFWNPIGLGAAGITAITAISSWTLILTIIALGLGASLIWILWNDYDFSFEGGKEYTDRNGEKHKVYGKASFKKHEKK